MTLASRGPLPRRLSSLHLMIGIPQVACAIVKQHAKNQELVALCLHLLSNLSVADASSVIRSGALDLILGAMAAHPDAVVLQGKAARCLLNLTVSPANARIVFAAGTLAQLSRSFYAHIKDPELCAYSTWTLLNLVASVPDASRAIGEEGTITSVIRGIHAHPLEENVVKQGCRLACKITEVSNTHADALKSGAAAILLAAAEAHLVSPSICKYTCMALAQLGSTSSPIAQEARLKISDSGGLRVVMAIIDSHFNVAEVVEDALWLLASMAALPMNRDAIYNSGCVKVVIQLLSRHSFHAGVQVKGISALANVTQHGENQIRVARLGAIPVLLASMYFHVGHRLVQEHGCRVLSNLAVAAVNKPAIVELGGIEAILSAMIRQAKVTKASGSVPAQGLLSLLGHGAGSGPVIGMNEDAFQNSKNKIKAPSANCKFSYECRLK
jgi:hypothetical protein